MLAITHCMSLCVCVCVCVCVCMPYIHADNFLISYHFFGNLMPLPKSLSMNSLQIGFSKPKQTMISKEQKCYAEKTTYKKYLTAEF